PMSLCVRSLYETFPKIKAFGCCHEVFGTQKALQSVYEQETGEKIADWHEILVNVTGINHFTWFTQASCHGADLFPIYRRYMEKHFEEGIRVESDSHLHPNFLCAHRVKMDLFRRYGWIAAAGDRHLAEFMPGDEYLRDPETVRKWGFTLTPVSWRKEDLQERLSRSERLADGSEEMELKPTGEEGILLIKALCGLTRTISNVNVPNRALQIPDLPADAVVETNAVFSRDSIRPIYAGPLTEEIRALLMPHIENHERILRAAASCSRELLYEAFLSDPLVKGHHCAEAEIKQLADDMVANTRNYLPAKWSIKKV
ncbi:MAG: alpha-glucosidase/alpha-galactosidase, partial [Lachnospiraceae bacterium]|nr:alpha-glucosidase/alpha-galactosidase [Lachnospiraceae bacterium]